MSFKEMWIADNLQVLKLNYPDSSESDIIDFLSKEFDKHCKSDEVIIYNNYERTQIKTDVLKTIDWLNKKKPITSESGTLFKQHAECWNPDTAILKGKLAERSVAKKQKFKHTSLAESSMLESDIKYHLELSHKFDLKQSRCKVIVNSEYGISGLRSSWFFNMAVASATTARGRALISTAENAFEDFLADNVRFLNMNECIVFILNIIEDRESRHLNDEDWIISKNIDDVIERLSKKFFNKDDMDIKLIARILSNVSQTDLNRIYYASNMHEFFKNSKKARTLLENIVLSGVEYLLPMKPPSEISGYLEKLRDAVLEFVHYNHPTTDRVYRLYTHTRKRVIVIDTDSNFINLGPWVDFVNSEIMNKYQRIKSRKIKNGYFTIQNRDYSKTDDFKNQQSNDFRIIHTMVFIISQMIANTLDVFVERCNLEDKSKNAAFMKNEFLYDSILLTDAMKHYQGTVRIQEGNLFKNPKSDIKGMEYNKPSMGGVQTRKFVKNLAFDDILMAKDVKPDIANIIRKLRKFEDDIRESLMNGDLSYFKTANIKTGDAYDSPFTIGTYKAAYTWNYLCPDKEIELPSTAYIVKVKVSKIKNIAHLATTFPDIYERFVDLFNLDVHMVDKKTKEKKIKKFGDGGIKNIALPIDAEMPEWMKTIIDTTEIVENNTRLSLSILNSLGLKTVYNSKSSQFISNIIEL